MMKNNMNSRKNAARIERQQRKLDADLVETLFPEVAGIVVVMTYNQQGLLKSFTRVINFFPGSSALFRINCLNKECVDGGYDFTQVIAGMIKNRSKTTRGNLSCEGSCPPGKNSTIAYNVVIQYTRDSSLQT
jgi:hypothetical protein